ncbi:MAG: hypothetical protein IT256_05455 [Chitinophagaceae bacterium]|nr:hypothetical protein [Chitinophagaceae bacterium]
MSRPWTYLVNTFESVTADSYRLAKKLGDRTILDLANNIANPYMADLHANLLPHVATYNTQYMKWKGEIGAQKSTTSGLTVLLKTLSSEKIARWDIQIQVLYPQGSNEYILLLPYRRAPFQHGSQEDRISAVGSLGMMLEGKQQLAATKAEVDAFFATLTNSFDTQKQKLNQTTMNSTALDAAREAVCVEMYYTLAMLMAYYKTNPAAAAAFFDVESIRNHEQTTFNGTVYGAELKLAMTHTFILGEEVRLVNRGNHDLRFALCTEANDAIGQPSVLVAAGNETIVRAEELGDVATQRYLKVENLAPAEDGKYTIMLL